MGSKNSNMGSKHNKDNKHKTTGGAPIRIENTYYQKYVEQSPLYISIKEFFENITSTDPNIQPWRSAIFKYLGIAIALGVICFFIFITLLNPGFTAYNLDKYFFLIVLPILIIFAFLLNIGSETSINRLFLKVSGGLLLVGLIVYYYIYSRGSGIVELGSNYALLALILIIGITVVYNIIIQYLSTLTGWPGFITQFIFYIPCIITDLWNSILENFKMTHYSIYIVLVIEFILIWLYIYLPTITTSYSGLDNGKPLLLKAVRLDKELQIIANSSDIRIPQDPNGSVKPNFRKNYCISMWVNVTPQNSSMAAYSRETEIFKYGFTDKSGIQHVKPMIRYYGGGDRTDIKDERDKYIFYFTEYPPKTQYTDPNNMSYEISVPNQRWNNFVINYNRNIVDIYINGILERSFNMSNQLPEYNDLDQITVASPDGNGVQGAICNVAFYNHPLSKEQIAFSYNMLMKSDPPVPINSLSSVK